MYIYIVEYTYVLDCKLLKIGENKFIKIKHQTSTIKGEKRSKE